MLGVKRFATARGVLAGIAAMAMLAKGQVRGVGADDAPAQRVLASGSSAWQPDRERAGSLASPRRDQHNRTLVS